MYYLSFGIACLVFVMVTAFLTVAWRTRRTIRQRYAAMINHEEDQEGRELLAEEINDSYGSFVNPVAETSFNEL